MAEHIPEFVNAGLLTMGYGLVGILLSIVLGLVVALINYYKLPFLRQLASFYIDLSRNTPLLVQLFLIYFGLPKLGLVLSSQTSAVVGLSFLGTAYMAETIRSGLEAVSPSQIESAISLGLNRWQVMRYVVWPQAFTLSFAGIVANVVFLIKETSVFSVVAIADLMYVAKDLIGIYYKTDETLWMLVLAYLVILLPISIMGTIIERRLRYGIFGS